VLPAATGDARVETAALQGLSEYETPRPGEVDTACSGGEETVFVGFSERVSTTSGSNEESDPDGQNWGTPRGDGGGRGATEPLLPR